MLEKNKQFKPETFMSIIRWALIDELKQRYSNVFCTYGYLTKLKRWKGGISKSHINGAFLIADGIAQVRVHTSNLFQKRKNNRGLQLNRKGSKPFIRRRRYKIQPHDLLTIKGKDYISKGIHDRGKYVVCYDKANIECDLSTKLITNVFHVKGLIWI